MGWSVDVEECQKLQALRGHWGQGYASIGAPWASYAVDFWAAAIEASYSSF
jgi:hypothetical protein